VKPGTRLILSWLHGFLLNYPQMKNLTCSHHVSSVQDSSRVAETAGRDSEAKTHIGVDLWILWNSGRIIARSAL
jgi:hypothetical protein